MKFAKLFESERYGQILITRDTDDEERLCLSLRCKIEGLECTNVISFDDSDGKTALEKEEYAFNDITKDIAELYVEKIYNVIVG